jgi:intracellular septation protein
MEPTPSAPQQPARQKYAQLRSILVGGLLPVIVFSVIEDRYGTLAGLIAGMVFGVGEIVYERVRLGKVDAFTWAGNGMILVLGGVSLVTNEGIWFKLQPAIIEAVTAVIFCGSVLIGRPLMAGLLKKQLAAQQGTQAQSLELAPWVVPLLGGATFRFGLFFGAHAALATWAAIHWSTAAWAALKGIGFTGTFILYGLLEAWVLRRRISKRSRGQMT